MKANEIKNALNSGQLSLSESLRRAQELLAGEGDKEALAWIKNELEGYASDAILPVYRKIPCEVYVEYEHPIYGSRVELADVQEVAEPNRKEFCTMYVVQGVDGIDTIVRRNNDEATRALIKDGKRNMILGAVYAQGQVNKAYQQTKISCMKGILDAVKKQLSDILREQIQQSENKTKAIRVLEVSRFKKNMVNGISPFVYEQGEAIRALGHEVGYFLVKGNYIKALKPLKAKIREFKPDIIHAHFGLSAITAELQSEVPVVTTFHNGETHNWHVNRLSSLFSLKAKHVIYVAPHIREMSYFKAKNYSIIPCGVTIDDCFLMDKAEARKKLGWNPEKKYVMFGGAFSDLRKNYELLRQAVERLKIEDRRLKIECIEMRGLTREQCVLLMNAADVFALPTKNEGSPQALKEAMACNCPIVATDVADIKHLLGDLPGHFVLPNKKGNSAWWKGDEHSVEELAELLKKALTFEGRTEGRKRIVEIGYTNELVAKKIVEIYENIIGK